MPYLSHCAGKGVCPAGHISTGDRKIISTRRFGIFGLLSALKSEFEIESAPHIWSRPQSQSLPRRSETVQSADQPRGCTLVDRAFRLHGDHLHHSTSRPTITHCTNSTSGSCRRTRPRCQSGRVVCPRVLVCLTCTVYTLLA